MPVNHFTKTFTMKKPIVVMLIMASFATGYAFNALTQYTAGDEKKPKRVTSIGGVFFKCKNPEAVRNWYNKHLGLNTHDYGATFVWYHGADSTQKGYTAWGPFKETTTYFAPSTKEFMINYRVENMNWLVQELKKEGVNVLDTIETYDYGKFVHILDLEGNKIQLWEPNDEAYGKIDGGTTK
jgi:predicted enzyme related to lactoylglutathione lyase